MSSAHSTRSEVSMATAARKTRPARPAPARRLAEHPFIYEVNTWVWLEELWARLGEKSDLAGVPTNEWDVVAEPFPIEVEQTVLRVFARR